MTETADVYAEDVQLDSNNACYSFQLRTVSDSIQVSLGLPGKHNLQNALAAAACALALEVDLQKIKQGLESFTGVPGRLQMKPGTAIDIFNSWFKYQKGPLSESVREFLGEKFGLYELDELGEDRQENIDREKDSF